MNVNTNQAHAHMPTHIHSGQTHTLIYTHTHIYTLRHTHTHIVMFCFCYYGIRIVYVSLSCFQNLLTTLFVGGDSQTEETTTPQGSDHSTLSDSNSKTRYNYFTQIVVLYIFI